MPRSSRCVFECDQFDILHRFPKPVSASLERFQLWKDIVGRYLEDKTDHDVYTNYRICNHHFEDRYFYPHSKRLAKTAYPTLNLGQGELAERSMEIEPILHSNTESSESQVPEQIIHQVTDSTPIQDSQFERCMEIKPMPQSHPGCSSHLQIQKQIINQGTGKLTTRKQANYKIKQLLQKIKIMGNKLKEQRTQIKAAKIMSKTKLFNKVLKSLPTAAQTFVNMQLTQHYKQSRGRRFNIDEKLLALSIYKKSPKGYTFLRKLFTLPSKRTLQDVLKLISLKPGLNPMIFKQIKDAAEKLSLEERLCLLMFDEMSLSPALHFNTTTDEIAGFEDFGENTRNENIADHVLVLMIKGLKAYYKQPICFAFCKSATKANILKQLIKDTIKQILQTGLIVVATVCDQSTINTKVIKELLSETKSEYLRLGKVIKHCAFEVENKKIYPLFDPPHLLKGIRNNFLVKNLRYTQDEKVKTAKWEHLKLLLNIDAGEDELRMCNKLTEAHVLAEKIPKMKVKHAAQIFSQRVSGALRFCSKHKLLPEDCSDTADILLLFDQLFDSFNGGSYKSTYKIYKNCLKSNSEHFALWNKALPILRSMRFQKEQKKKDGSVSLCYEQVPSIKNWIHNINTIKDLWQYLHNEHNVKTLLMRSLNQDPVENFFSSVRSHGARNINPTCQQFENIYKTLLVNFLNSTHSLGANCEEDFNKILHNLDCLLAKNDTPLLPRRKDEIDIDFLIEDLGGSGLQIAETKIAIETKKYVAGYVIKKLKINVCKACNRCNLEMFDTVPPQEDEYIYSVDITKKSLQRPSQNFLSCSKNIIKIIKNVLKKDPFKSGLSERIKILIDISVDFRFLTCNKHSEKLKTYMINLIIKLIVHSWCNNVNRILKGRHIKFDDDDRIKIQALKYYVTHSKIKSK